MPNPQQLKERIYALNPELKALTMGCEVRTDSEKYIIASDLKDSYRYRVIGKHYQEFLPEDSIVEIIGKPIELSHVLRAIGEKYSSADVGGFTRDLLNNGYSLTKTFDQNIAENEELVTFLLSIIK